jgi:NAD-dependent SIR2 family protein deacetylase
MIIGITFLVRRYGNLYRYKTGSIIAAALLIAVIFGAGLSTFGVGDYRHAGQNYQQNSPRWNK